MDRAVSVDVKMLRAEMQVAQLAAMTARSWVRHHEGKDPLSAGYWRRQAEGAEQILARAGRKVTEATP